MDLIGGSVASTSQVIDKLVSLLTRGAELLKGVGISDVEGLRADLEHLKSFLRDAEAISEAEELSDSVKDWLKRTKNVAELIEDVVDEYVLKASQRWNQGGFVNFLGKAGRLIGALNSRPNLASNLQNISTLLLEIKEKGQQNNLFGDTSNSRTRVVGLYHHRQQMHPIFKDSTVRTDSAAVGLARRLIGGESRRSVISLVGTGGIGKTTLAKKVYDDIAVREHFQFRGWITVTRSYKIEELLWLMLQHISSVGISRMPMEELISTLNHYLQPKRYFFVFDDVWDENLWQFMKDVLPDAGSGSRIIITTRSDIVAALFKESSFDRVHRLEPLSLAMSWDLFQSKAFEHGNGWICPPQLKNLCLCFINMCEGLPLAIVALAGFLSTREKTLSVWQRLVDDFHSHFTSDPHLSYLLETLTLSFYDLPHRLRLCFLYFSIFPKDTLIPNDKLFKLWIAEGFVQEKEGAALEEVAEEYLKELVGRNLVQACEGLYGLEKFCRVNILMHEIACLKANEISFCVRAEKNSTLTGKSRRLSIYNNVTDNVLETTEDSKVRSVFLFNIGSLNYYFMAALFQKYNLLTMLDCENVPLKYLPYELGNLFHLKYLNLKNTKVKRLPKSVGKLLNLQTMDLRNTLLFELPKEISLLRNLRHLLANGYGKETRMELTKGVKVKDGIGCLENLQTLMTVEAHLSGIGVVKELENLRRLRRLSISRLTAEAASTLCGIIKEMNHLISLSLKMMNGDEILDLESISNPPPLLECLALKGRLQKLPNWISRLQNLSMLCLSLSRLTDDPLQDLCLLPNLVCLWLHQAYEGEQLCFEEGAFEKLKLLVLRELHGLNLVKIKRGALPLLEELRIGSNPLLNKVPIGINWLRNLKVLVNCDMPNEFVLSMQPNGGSDYWKVKRVPSVLFWYRVEERRYISYKNGESKLLNRLQGSASNVQHTNLELSFFYSDVEEDIGFNWFSFSGDRNNIRQLSYSSSRNSTGHLSFSSGFYTDDIEE